MPTIFEDFQSEPTVVYPCNSWVMNQQSDEALQTLPSWPLLYGVDGREMGALRRFRGFKRLDHDIREYNNGSFISIFEHAHYRVGGTQTPINVWPRYGPHDWSGYPPALNWLANPNTFRAESLYDDRLGFSTAKGGMLVADFRAVTIGRQDGGAPLVGFVLSTARKDKGQIENPGDVQIPIPIVKLMVRQLGAESGPGGIGYSTLQQALLMYSGDVGIALDAGRPGVDATLPRPNYLRGSLYERLGIEAIGRLLFISHPERATEYFLPLTTATGELARSHPLVYVPLAYLELPTLYADFPPAAPVTPTFRVSAPAGAIMGGKSAGTMYWDWFGWEGNEKFQIRLRDMLNFSTPHPVGSKVQVRVRFINRTTGFVGPMSSPLKLHLNESTVDETGATTARRATIKFGDWSVATGHIGFGTNSGSLPAAVRYVGLGGARSLGGADHLELLGRDSVFDCAIQVFCTQSSSPDNPAWGLGVFFLDGEYPLKIRWNPTTGTWQFADIISFPPPYTSTDAPLVTAPVLSNDELAFAEQWDPEFDIPVELSGGEALGDLDGLLASVQNGVNTLEANSSVISKGDLRVSPPWKWQPTAWTEACAPNMFHRVIPKTLDPATFCKVGSLLFYASKNKMVRLRRDSTKVYMQDGADTGPCNREAISSNGTSMFLCLDTDIIEINAATNAIGPVGLVHRLISDKWRQFVKQGSIMSGYDPQLDAVFFAPRPAWSSYDNTLPWMRSEAIILWLSTGRVTMLHDVYWVGMSRGTHPVTGREHLFFIDPAGNITYPDDTAADDDTQVSTMTGINKFTYPTIGAGGPQRMRARPVINVEITDYAALAAYVAAGNAVNVVVAGINFKTGAAEAARRWTVAVDIATTLGTLQTAILNHVRPAPTSRYTGLETAGVLGPAIGIAGVWGPAVTLLPANIYGTSAAGFRDPLNVPGITMGSWSASEVGVPIPITDEFGGVVGFKVFNTAIVGSSLRLLAEELGKRFDMYSWYNPWPPTELETYMLQPALRGAQAYLMREYTEARDGYPDQGVTRTIIIADGRIDNNGPVHIDLPTAELNWRNDPVTGTPFGTGDISLLTDYVVISPVVLQVVGCPVVPKTPGTDIPNEVSTALQKYVAVNTIQPALDRRGGVTALPEGMRTLASRVFVGCTIPRELDAMRDRFGAPLRPAVETSKDLSATNHTLNAVAVARGGYAIMPVVTSYCPNDNFDLLQLAVRATASTEEVTGDSDA